MSGYVELESVRPVDDMSASFKEEHSGASSRVITTSSRMYPPSSLPLEGVRGGGVWGLQHPP